MSQQDPGAAAGAVELDADDCERVFYAALRAGDARGVEAALTVMAVRDPHRAEVLLNWLKVALAIDRGAL